MKKPELILRLRMLGIAESDYKASKLLRDCLIVRVTARCCFAERPVYLRGRIFPVSVT